MHFRHILAKIQLKNLKQHFDWGDRGSPGSLSPLATPLVWTRHESSSPTISERQFSLKHYKAKACKIKSYSPSTIPDSEALASARMHLCDGPGEQRVKRQERSLEIIDSAW